MAGFVYKFQAFFCSRPDKYVDMPPFFFNTEPPLRQSGNRGEGRKKPLSMFLLKKGPVLSPCKRPFYALPRSLGVWATLSVGPARRIRYMFAVPLLCSLRTYPVGFWLKTKQKAPVSSPCTRPFYVLPRSPGVWASLSVGLNASIPYICQPGRYKKLAPLYPCVSS